MIATCHTTCRETINIAMSKGATMVTNRTSGVPINITAKGKEVLRNFLCLPHQTILCRAVGQTCLGPPTAHGRSLRGTTDAITTKATTAGKIMRTIMMLLKHWACNKGRTAAGISDNQHRSHQSRSRCHRGAVSPNQIHLALHHIISVIFSSLCLPKTMPRSARIVWMSE
jgi:hypothetical protein